MKKEDKIYLAGFLDGANFTITKCKDLKGCVYYQPSINAYSSSKEILEWCKKVTNLGHVVCRKARSPKHSDSYEWQVRGYKVEKLLKEIYPYLKIKRKHAELLLQWCKRKKGSPYTEEDLTIVNQIRELNKKGNLLRAHTSMGQGQTSNCMVTSRELSKER